ncbi:DUF4124 domain-containing protein [Geoalkalibacter subterraneus]|jgi:hypothetical protein|uniref:Uncharacterized protein n=1 Tax=Geoalkalibacter subterraneus TaxID=483547 RepID=A0A0B5FEB3_9BACT|nr:DUF4124 domain-containing protein [Geoalkalibacter subterraneus]AJF05628.1 hypothetical protein GSUB_02300 [Geoalkalibacter subterraneus]
MTVVAKRLLLAALIAATCLPAHAEIYRCRQASGSLLMTDDPSKFPPGCTPVEKNDSEGEGAAGSFSLMPETEVPSAGSGEVEQAVSEQRQRLEERRARIAEWRDKASELASQYEQAVARRNQAYSSWSYDSREVVRKSLEEMTRIKKEKQQLLQEVEKSRIPSPDRQAIRQTLSAIPE